ncbi:hypothetical protein A2382_01340 [Candidatus Woesebacteria bacterium RIFOXYB1_FULL_38_16]|uniref:Uncharacterized protein n=1 Tax=Candidatus Woesebacteria bacterium RIFOXYB1_FULL_38_16 TaxID=1802538 RepID=A0A1F8CRZ6_9BACT|nr:MAG: hypothetical protein A2191_03365 [Candidatus Woesebacteria bacterium RIFOXYA1_FULL_38_9]OGM79042.1 MAG: hypothetical protein A2382_01340 [Candidatus Woesebacteria bacterium RIFOXYB1_FULL_38_16]
MSTGTVQPLQPLPYEPEEIEQVLIASGMPAGAARTAYRNISQTSVALARGQMPDRGLKTYVFNKNDMSGSMLRVRQDLINAYNEDFLGGLLGSSEPDQIFVSTCNFNDSNYANFVPDPADPDSRADPLHLVHAAIPLSRAPQLTDQIYVPGGFTPLYDSELAFLAGVMAYIEKLLARGVSIHRVITLSSTDGREEGTGHYVNQPAEVAPVVQAMRDMGIYIPVFIGFGDQMGFRQVAVAMGYDPDNVLIAGSGASEYRRVFGLVSRRSVGVSQGKITPGNKFLQT